jgi:hypothetical protein
LCGRGRDSTLGLVKRVAVVLALAFTLVPAAGAAKLTYTTQRQAERFLEHGLKEWRGVDLRSRKYKFHVAFCLPGARSKYERRHTRYRVHTTATGEQLYHSFACTLAAANKVWHLYLVARPNGSFAVRTDT